MIFNDIFSADALDFVAVSHSSLYFQDFASPIFVFSGDQLQAL
jgi:hypothetical protein